MQEELNARDKRNLPDYVAYSVVEGRDGKLRERELGVAWVTGDSIKIYADSWPSRSELLLRRFVPQRPSATFVHEDVALANQAQPHNP